MEICIIKVGMFEGKGFDALKPILFEIIESLLPENIRAVYIDDRKEKLPQNINSKVIVFSFDTFSAKRAYQLCKKYKRKDNIIAMGGFHPTVCPQEALRYGDVVFCGDAEGTLPEFFNDLNNNRVKKLYDAKNNHCSMALLNNNRELPYRSKYLPLGLVQFSRGCRFSCDFCSVKTMYPGKVQQKTPAEMVSEIKATKEKFIFFVDDNLLYNEKTATALLKAIIPLRKKWACQISLEVANNERLLKLMRASGCICVLIGFESLNENNLKTMGKSANLLLRDYEQAIKKLQSYNFMVYGTFVIGYDEDDKKTANRIYEFALKNNLSVANFNPLIPFPGTPLYERLLSQNRLLHKEWWLSLDYCYGDSAFLPTNMTPKQLKQSCKEARYNFYGAKSILKRFFATHLTMGVSQSYYFLLINIISGLEIRRKQGAILGGSNE